MRSARDMAWLHTVEFVMENINEKQNGLNIHSRFLIHGRKLYKYLAAQRFVSDLPNLYGRYCVF